MTGTHTIYGYELSYFTRKVEAAFELSGVPCRRLPKTLWRKWPLERLSGTHQVPVVRTPGWRLLSDSTPIITYLDGISTRAPLHGVGPAGVLIRVVEEWLDEWLPRVVIHYRWNDAPSASAAAEALARETLPWAPSAAQRKVGHAIQRWGLKACRALGVDTPHQQVAAEEEARSLFEALEQQLGETPFALGEHPTAVDATLIGGLRAHFLADPAPRRMLDAFPRVVAWAQRPPSAASAPEPIAFPELTHLARHVIRALAGPYKDYILANARALEAGERAFTVTMHGEPQSYLARAYPERSRQMVNAVIAALSTSEHAEVGSWLRSHALDEIFGA